MPSLPSRYGPSVTTGGPSGPNRTQVAVCGPCSCPVAPIFALCSPNHAPTWAYLVRSSSGVNASNAAASSALPQNNSRYFMASPPPLPSNGGSRNSTTRAHPDASGDGVLEIPLESVVHARAILRGEEIQQQSAGDGDG